MSGPAVVWSKYLASINEDPRTTKVECALVDHFCHEEEASDRLYRLAVDGIKRATAGSVLVCKHYDEPILEPGDLSILTNFDETECCVIRTVRSTIKKFSEINEEDAFIEGEGDRSLAYWRQAHLAFFRDEFAELGLEFSDDIEVVFEEFRVEYVEAW